MQVTELQGKIPLRRIDIDTWLMSKWILEKLSVRLKTGLNWTRIRSIVLHTVMDIWCHKSSEFLEH
jgi:hypothetical protein